jgi:molecular chaperone DnaK
METTKTVWGIDLGTTYSCISRVDEHGYPVVVHNTQGNPITPSVVLFSGPDEVVVGEAAKDQMQLEPELVCELVKQNMGSTSWAFRAHDRDWSAAEVSSFILRELAQAAEQGTGAEVKEVVITVPAYFGVAEREATINAGKMAGLEVKDVLNEPTAAAFSYGFAQTGQDEETVLVYDLGGGTFDVTVIRLEMTPGGGTGIRVAATGGDDRLGGALWDQRLVTLLASKFIEAAPDAVDPLDDPIASADLRIKAEAIKRSLSTRESHTELIIAGTDRAKVTVTRDEFESATQDLLEQTIDFTRRTIDIAKEKGAATIDRVLLVGGSSFMPAVSRRLTEVFPEWTPELSDPNQAVAKGAALAGLQQALMDAILGEDAAAATVDGSSNGGGEGAPTPTAEQIQRAAREFGMSASLVEKTVKTEFTNVCSRGFGVKLVRDEAPDKQNPREPDDFRVHHIILPNTPLPVAGSEEGRVQTYFTIVDNQDSVMLEIWEQDSRDPHEDLPSNKFLESGLFQMTKAYAAGTPIRVALGMDNSGSLRLHATDADGREMEFNATSSGAVMSEEQLLESTAKVQGMRQGE